MDEDVGLSEIAGGLCKKLKMQDFFRILWE